MVYNITVADDHSYYANGMLSSNCGGTGAMLAIDPKGDCFPCIRYMHSSLGEDQVPLKIGDIEHGIYQLTEDKETFKMLDGITRRSQSTDECFYCEIASGCAWCSGWNYQLYGTPNKRCTRICTMHKARALANAYFWNKRYLKEGTKKYFHNYLREEEALKIISKTELDLLKEVENSAKLLAGDVKPVNLKTFEPFDNNKGDR